MPATRSTVDLDMLEQLNLRMIKMTPDKYVAPEMDPENDSEAFGSATELLKQRYSVTAELFCAYEALGQPMDALSAELAETLDDERAQVLEESLIVYKRLADQRYLLFQLSEFLLWVEVANAFPDENIDPVNEKGTFYSDWSIAKPDPEALTLEELKEGVPYVYALPRSRN